jgi:transposase-like protein
MTPPKRKKREYSPETKAAALALLASCGGNTRAAARQLAAAGQRIPEATLRGWAKQPLELPEQELVDDAKRELDVILESVVGKIALGLDRPAAITRILSRPVQAGTVLGILIDKLRVLRGQASEITEQRTLSGFLSTAKWLEPDEKEKADVRPN